MANATTSTANGKNRIPAKAFMTELGGYLHEHGIEQRTCQQHKKAFKNQPPLNHHCLLQQAKLKAWIKTMKRKEE